MDHDGGADVAPRPRPRCDAASVRLGRVRLRGTLAATALLPVAAGVVVALTLSGAVRIPPGVVSALVALPLIVAVRAAWTEWRLARPGPLPETPGVPAVPVHDDGVTRWQRRAGWALTAVSLAGGALPALFSRFFALAAAMPATCAPFSPPDGGNPAHENYCATPTHAEAVASGVWWAVIAVTVALVALAAATGRRSRTAAFAAPGIVLAGCVIAADLARVAAALIGRG